MSPKCSFPKLLNVLNGQAIKTADIMELSCLFYTSRLKTFKKDFGKPPPAHGLSLSKRYIPETQN